MAHARLIDRYRAALVARGYTVDERARSARYVVMRSPRVGAIALGAEPLTRGEHRVLLGRAGALRLTRSTVDRALDVSERFSATLLLEAENLP